MGMFVHRQRHDILQNKTHKHSGMKCVDSGDENDWHKIQNAIVYLRMNQQTEILTKTRKRKEKNQHNKIWWHATE